MESTVDDADCGDGGISVSSGREISSLKFSFLSNLNKCKIRLTTLLRFLAYSFSAGVFVRKPLVI